MDTRRKILTPARAVEIAADLRHRRISFYAVSGYFDVLRSAVVQTVESCAAPGARLFALVLQPPRPVIPFNARVELAAALRVIDYVVRVDGDPADLVGLLKPAAWIREEAAHQESTDRLIRHVLERHGRHPEQSESH